MSVRTTFDAVTHALLRAQLTDAEGKDLGSAIDLVDGIDEIMGEDAGAGGDRQFRLYVYLKPRAVDVLGKSTQFFHDRDNASYHKGFPTCYRLKNGPPSIQFSISRDNKMADVDVDYRSSSFPKAVFNGHLTASNSDVRAGDNLQRHDQRWEGLDGWWREVFGLLGSGSKPPKEEAVQRRSPIPLNTPLKADQGIDKSAHDFLKTWLVDKHPNNAVAYFSRRSYPCLQPMVEKSGKSVPQGMLQLRTGMAMKEFSDRMGPVDSVDQVFEPADTRWQQLKEAKNAYGAEFRLVNLPADIAQDDECVPASEDESGKKSKDKYYATILRGKKGDAVGKIMSLLWAQEGNYWKITAVRIEDTSGQGRIPTHFAATAEPAEPAPKAIAGDPGVVKDITEFYQLWIEKRDIGQALGFVSQRSYPCLAEPSAEEEQLTPNLRTRAALERLADQIPRRANLSEMMSGVQPKNQLLRPVEHGYSKAFAVMGLPDQKADSFLCHQRDRPEKSPNLTPADARYGGFYLSGSTLSFGEEESPALLLLWARENSRWKVVAWAVEVP